MKTTTILDLNEPNNLNTLLITPTTNDEYHFTGSIPSEELIIDFYAPTIEEGLLVLSDYDFDVILED